ncbi:MAG TPA: hypothetical protein VIX12_06145, partial [Candidatus Binataceae bacterium]
MRQNSWLIGDWQGGFPVLAAHFARLRGFNVEFCPAPAGALPSLEAGPNQLVATNFQVVERLAAAAKTQLRDWVEKGTTLYVRGAPNSGGHYSLMPFHESCFRYAGEKPAVSYRFGKDPTLPAALEGEQASCEIPIPCAEEVMEPFRPLLYARGHDGKERPAIFSLRYGAGTVVYDLHSDDINSPTAPLLSRLGNRSERPASVGALLAADIAAGRDPKLPSAFNIVIDDRPRNYDYFSASRLWRLLQHLEDLYPGIHVDFAWTPDQMHTGRRYIEIIKQFNTGFVWHG